MTEMATTSVEANNEHSDATASSSMDTDESSGGVESRTSHVYGYSRWGIIINNTLISYSGGTTMRVTYLSGPPPLRLPF